MSLKKIVVSYIFIISLFLKYPLSLTAQVILNSCNTENDTKLWLSLKHQHRFSKSWKLQSGIQVRFHQQLSILQRSLAEIELRSTPRKVKFLRAFDIGLGFRVLGVNDTKGKKQGFRLGFRGYGIIQYKQDWERWTFGYRFIYQDLYGMPQQHVSVSEYPRQQTLRNRLGIGYNFKKWKLDPKFQAELFYQLNTREGFNAFRLSLGTNYKINKFHKIKLRFIYEQSIDVRCTLHKLILALGYQLSTKARKKKN